MKIISSLVLFTFFSLAQASRGGSAGRVGRSEGCCSGIRLLAS
jgi:hypothetical protein